MPEKRMNTIIKKAAEFDIPVVGVAAAERLNSTAPDGFRPEDYLPGARSVVVLARPLPKSVFVTENDPHYMFYTRAFADNYVRMNAAAGAIAALLESEDFVSLPVPAYSPLRFHKGEPRGIMSFKHAAAEAGLGKLSKSTIFIHPEYGNILRLGGVITTAELPAGQPQEYKKICPPSCDLCEKACPVGALQDGKINITKCMTNCVAHTLLPPYPIQSSMRWMASKSKSVDSFLEFFTLSMFENYGIKCMQCLLVCPHFPVRKKK